MSFDSSWRGQNGGYGLDVSEDKFDDTMLSVESKVQIDLYWTTLQVSREFLYARRD